MAFGYRNRTNMPCRVIYSADSPAHSDTEGATADVRIVKAASTNKLIAHFGSSVPRVKGQGWLGQGYKYHMYLRQMAAGAAAERI